MIAGCVSCVNCNDILYQFKNSLTIPKGGNQNPYIEEEQTNQWPKEKNTQGQTTIKKTYI